MFSSGRSNHTLQFHVFDQNLGYSGYARGVQQVSCGVRLRIQVDQKCVKF